MAGDAKRRFPSVADDPLRHALQVIQERHGVGQLMGLAGRNPEGDSMTHSVGDHASLGAVAATGTAKRFTMASLDLRSPLRDHAERDAARLHEAEQALPDLEPRPANKDLGGAPA
jgi:hypothetical protein